MSAIDYELLRQPIDDVAAALGQRATCLREQGDVAEAVQIIITGGDVSRAGQLSDLRSREAIFPARLTLADRKVQIESERLRAAIQELYLRLMSEYHSAAADAEGKARAFLQSLSCNDEGIAQALPFIVPFCGVVRSVHRAALRVQYAGNVQSPEQLLRNARELWASRPISLPNA